MHVSSMHAGGELGLGYQNYDMDSGNGGEPGGQCSKCWNAGGPGFKSPRPHHIIMIISIYGIIWIFIIFTED